VSLVLPASRSAASTRSAQFTTSASPMENHLCIQ
jgi:hypothetical protein